MKRRAEQATKKAASLLGERGGSKDVRYGLFERSRSQPSANPENASSATREYPGSRRIAVGSAPPTLASRTSNSFFVESTSTTTSACPAT